MLTKPERLCSGDTVGIIAPASPPPNPLSVSRAAEALEQMGFRPKLGKHVRERRGFLAGSDRQRAEDLMRMFADRTVKAIVCLRGGYGTARLLSRLDFRFIRRNPKILVGYSDITSLHCALLTRANLISFHGPMLDSDFLKQDLPPFTVDSFQRTLMRATPPGSLCQGYGQTTTVLRPGTATGRLIGGNLSLLCTTLGTAYQPSFKGKLLFFEDLDEPPYRFDRMLTHLLNAGLLQQVAGVAVGINTFTRAQKAERYESGVQRQTVADVLNDRLLPLKVPVVMGLPFGHTRFNATLPIGARATLDARNGDLIVTETPVA